VVRTHHRIRVMAALLHGTRRALIARAARSPMTRRRVAVKMWDVPTRAIGEVVRRLTDSCPSTVSIVIGNESPQIDRSGRCVGILTSRIV
jgi:hypothetical protein